MLVKQPALHAFKRLSTPIDIVLKKVAQPLGHDEHLLPQWQRRENVIDPSYCRICRYADLRGYPQSIRLCFRTGLCRC